MWEKKSTIKWSLLPVYFLHNFQIQYSRVIKNAEWEFAIHDSDITINVLTANNR